MTDTKIHSWLRRKPVPASLRLDGKKTVLIGDGPKRWRDAIAAIEALGPSMIEAQSADGHVLRVTQIEAPDDDDDDDDAEPVTPGPSVADAQRSRDIELASIIMEAGDRGARRHAEAYTLAFARQTELVQMLVDRLGGVENAWQESINQRAEDVANAPSNDDPAGSAIGNLVSLAMQAKGNAPSGAKK